MPIRAQAADDTIHEFPDGTPDSVVDKAMRDYAGQASGPVADPNDWRTKLRASPIGALQHGAMEGIYGGLQLGGKLESAITSLGGLAPNPVSRYVDRAVSDLDKTRQLDEATYQAARKATGGNPDSFDVGRLIGNAASPANAVGGEIGGLARALPYGARLGRALLEGGYYGATQPVEDTDNFWKEKGLQVATGSGTGGALHGAGTAAKKVIDPQIQAQAKLLLKEGVPLTIGQTLGGTAKTFEDTLKSVPFVRDVIQNRERDSLVGLQNAAINRSLAPIGAKLPSDLQGHSAIAYADDALGRAYDTVLSKLNATADQKLAQDITGIANNAANYGVVGPAETKLQALLKNQILEKAGPNGTYGGAALKDIQSNLSHQARIHAKSLNPDDKNLADALFDAKAAFDDFIMRQNPNEAPTLTKINQGWAMFARPQGAAEKAMKEGISTPAQLGMAVRQGGTRGQNASGRALMQDLSTAGQAVLPSTVPDSGTPLRHAVQLGLGLAGAGLGGERLGVPGSEGGALGAAALGAILAAGGTRGGQKMLRAALTKRPQNAPAIADAVQQLAPRGATALIPLLLNQGGNTAPK